MFKDDKKLVMDCRQLLGIDLRPLQATGRPILTKRFKKLTDEHNTKEELEVKKTLETVKLKVTHNSIVPRRTGSIPLTRNMLHSYEKHYLYFFFSHFEDYENLLMLRKEPFEYFPSMNPTSIVLHHKWKIGQKDSPLLDDKGKEILDLDGKPIACVGAWISPENLEQC